MRRLSIAGLQLDLAKSGNLSLIREEIRCVKARLPWIDLIVLSELAAHGISTAAAERLPGPTEKEFITMARDNGVWLIPGSLFERDGDNIYNTASVIDPAGNVVARYRKLFPFYPYEAGVTGGDQFCVFGIPGIGRIGLTICYDIWFPEVWRTLTFLGAEVIVNTSLTNTVDRDSELALNRAAAASNQCYVFSVNGAGLQGVGRSIMCGAGGEVLYQSGSGRDIIAMSLDLDEVADVRRRGWNGLGQVLKSFRDHPLSFPPYAVGARSAALDALGPLAKPTNDRD